MPPDAAPVVPSRRSLRLAGLALLVIAVGVAAAGIVTRHRDARQLEEWTAARAVPTVAVERPVAGERQTALELPGRLEAHARAPIHARVSGYLKSWQADIGARVRAGQQLAEIETPELDQQLLQARADLASAESAARLAAATAERWQTMLAVNAVSRQGTDEKVTELANRKAMVEAARANVARLRAMKDFARIVAPFDGTVTARSTDIGDLINAGSAAGPELFVVSDTRRLRVYVNVPQNYTPSIRDGGQATISVPEYPGRTFPARIVTSAQAIDSASGAMLVQLEIDNGGGELLPGGYAVVSLALTTEQPSLSIPASALLFDRAGVRVATVDAQDHVHLRPVTITRDLGPRVEVGAGLEPDARVIASPPDGIRDGDAVSVVQGGAPAPAGGAGAPRSDPATGGRTAS